MICAFRSRPGTGPRRQRRLAVPQEHARPRPPCRAPRLQALLARRASQHAGHRQRGDLGGHRPCRGGNLDDPRRRGRHHAAQPRAAGDRRAVRDARRLASRPHRPRARPRAGHRHGHRKGAAAQPRCQRRRLPAGRRRAASAISARPSKTSACGRCPAKASRSRSGSWGRAPMARSSPRCSACPTPSPRISRRPRWNMRSTSTGRASSRPSSSTGRMRCSASMSSPRRPTRRRGCCSARCSRPSSICAPGGPDGCRPCRRLRAKSRSDGQGDAGAGALASRRRLA